MCYAHSPVLILRTLAITLSIITVTCAKADEVGSVAAIWRVQNLPFEFRGDNVAYTCEQFRKKVRAVLISVGAHPSVIVQARCSPATSAGFVRAPDASSPGRESEGLPARVPAKLSTRIVASISLATPAIASEENVREATTFNSQRELVAKVNDEPLPTPATIPMFRAIWAPIALNNVADTSLEAGDCELLRQLSRQVFPKIGVEVTRSKLVCSPSVISKPSIEVRALVPMINIKRAD